MLESIETSHIRIIDGNDDVPPNFFEEITSNSDKLYLKNMSCHDTYVVFHGGIKTSPGNVLQQFDEWCSENMKKLFPKHNLTTYQSFISPIDNKINISFCQSNKTCRLWIGNSETYTTLTRRNFLERFMKRESDTIVDMIIDIEPAMYLRSHINSYYQIQFYCTDIRIYDDYENECIKQQLFIKETYDIFNEKHLLKILCKFHQKYNID
jgi:hypothetical protein